MNTNRASKSDENFVRAFEAFEIKPGEFSHRCHLRMAYTYLCKLDTETTCLRLRHLLCGFLAHNGIKPSTKYHETMTRAWTLAVRHFMTQSPNTKSAEEFIDGNPGLLYSEVMMKHYSREVLHSDAARSRFVEPDLIPIPWHDDDSVETKV